MLGYLKAESLRLSVFVLHGNELLVNGILNSLSMSFKRRCNLNESLAYCCLHLLVFLSQLLL